MRPSKKALREMAELAEARRSLQGSWPDHCEQRAFVKGAAWWLFKATGFTPFSQERREMEAEAVRLYGEPAAPPAIPDTAPAPAEGVTAAHFVRVLATCPNCNGAKTVSRPPWIAGDVQTWMAGGDQRFPCPTCEARGYIDPPQPPATVTVYNPDAEELERLRASLAALRARIEALPRFEHESGDEFSGSYMAESEEGRWIEYEAAHRVLRGTVELSQSTRRGTASPIATSGPAKDRCSSCGSTDTCLITFDRGQPPYFGCMACWPKFEARFFVDGKWVFPAVLAALGERDA